jgi:hypothetical protein
LPKAATEAKWGQSRAQISRGLATLFKPPLGNCNNHPKVVATRTLSKSERGTDEEGVLPPIAQVSKTRLNHISSGGLKPTKHKKHNRKYIKI